MSTIRIQPPFDIRKDFWEMNYPLRYVSPFDEAYDLYGHEGSSAFMWCIWLLEHPSIYNPYRNLPEAQKVGAVQKYMDGFDPEDELTTNCIAMFNHICLSPVSKGFKEEEQTMLDRQKMITSLQTKFNNLLEEDPLLLRDRDTVNLMKYHEAMRANTAKVYMQYEEAKKIFEEEEGNLQLYGGGSEDIMESGGLIELDD